MLLTNSLLLLMAAGLTVSAAGPLAWKDLGNGQMQLTDNGRPALVYNYGPQLKEGAPAEKKRCCYLFPIYTPAGVSMLDDFPKDHWHHRGVFWAWPVVEVGGKTYDGWMNFTVRDHSDRPPKVSVDAKGAKLEANNTWQIDGTDVVRETFRMTAYPASGSAREFDAELNLVALKEPVTLRGSHEQNKSYGGFSARFADRTDTVIRADGEVLTKDEDLNPRKWAELEGVYNGKRAALRITPDPSDPLAPYQWCLRKYGFAGASFPGKSATVDHYTLEPGKPVTLKFRVRVSDVQ